MRRAKLLTSMVALSMMLGLSNAGHANTVLMEPMDEQHITIASPFPHDLPPYLAVIRPVSTDRLAESWRPGCPVDPAQLRLVSLSMIDFDGRVTRGELVVADHVAAEVAHIFAELYFDRFPIQRMQTVERYGADDDASMAANNTSAFNCRPVTGGTAWSNHSYGLAIDINPVQNPYISRSGAVYPPSGSSYVDRTVAAPGLIRADDLAVRAFESRGWEWGGRWASPIDYQHFEKPGGKPSKTNPHH